MEAPIYETPGAIHPPKHQVHQMECVPRVEKTQVIVLKL
jgi:hypothetical protein